MLELDQDSSKSVPSRPIQYHCVAERMRHVGRIGLFWAKMSQVWYSYETPWDINRSGQLNMHMPFSARNPGNNNRDRPIARRLSLEANNSTSVRCCQRLRCDCTGGAARNDRWIFIVCEGWMQDDARYLRPITVFEPREGRDYWERYQ